MKAQQLFREYTWLVDTIRKARKISFAEINERWMESDMGGGKPIPRATFSRHRIDIEEMFGLLIGCDATDGYRYYIANPEVLHDESVQNYMLGTMSVNSIVADSFCLQDRILMESAPVEGELLKRSIEAMRKGVKVRVDHCRYGANEVRTFVMAPYCLKLFKHRWYMLGHMTNEPTERHPESEWKGMFSFDRIRKMQLTDERFEVPNDFDAQEFFRHCYGVLIGYDTPPEQVVLRAFGQQQYYLRDLPIHHSQKVLQVGEDWTDYAYYLRPTHDFVNALLGMGKSIKVVQPKHLADEVKEELVSATELYSE